MALDIVRAFEAVGLANSVLINIQGTPEEPLFQANQVGALLGMANIRESLKVFGGSQLALFLTELDLYRLLGMSRKPIARSFQKWVASVVKEIRLTRKYDLEQRLAAQTTRAQRLLEEKTAAGADAQRLLAEKETTEAESQRLLAEKQAEKEAAEAESQRLLAEKVATEAELQRYKERTFDPVPTCDRVYINKEVAELASDRHKVGMTIDEKKRQSNLNTGSAQGAKMIFRVKTNNGKVVETIVGHALRRYHWSREHYKCRVEHTINVIKVAAAVCDTLASTYEHITTGELSDRVVAAVTTALHASGESDSDSESADGGTLQPTPEIHPDTLR
jgi:prophage antirepressor-like protein